MAHDSGRFRLTRQFAGTVLGNLPAVWRRKAIGIGVANGVDEISLALVADSWARTFAASAYAVGSSPAVSLNGMRFVTKRDLGTFTPVELKSASAMRNFDVALASIEAAFGPDTANLVRTQLELDAM